MIMIFLRNKSKDLSRIILFDLFLEHTYNFFLFPEKNMTSTLFVQSDNHEILAWMIHSNQYLRVLHTYIILHESQFQKGI